jgi:hypothetical protein
MLIVLLIFWIFVFITSSLIFDNLIEYQNKNHNQAWILDGKPSGMFFKPEGGSTFAMQKLSFSLPKSKPKWVKGDVVAEKIYAKYVFIGKLIKWYAIAFIPLLIIAASI